MRTSDRKLGILFLNICRIMLRLGDSDCSIWFNSSSNFSHSLSINCTRTKCIYCSRGSFSSGGSLDRSSLISGACKISQAIDSFDLVLSNISVVGCRTISDAFPYLNTLTNSTIAHCWYGAQDCTFVARNSIKSKVDEI
jgi:hypothetical protein